MEHRQKRGPYKPASDRRTERVVFYVTPVEWADLADLANQAGAVSPTNFARRLVLDCLRRRTRRAAKETK